MNETAPPPRPEPMAGMSAVAQWSLLLVLSVIFVAILEFAAMPAALLLGPMMAAILAGTNGATVRPPRLCFAGAQAVVGCLVSASIEPEILDSFLDDWPLFLAVVAATLAASSFLGWMISRWKILPGTTGVWGSSPGGATAMVLMAEAFGADGRLVAFMQYLRVILVSLAAALIARLWVDTSGVEPPATVWFPPLQWPAFPETLAIALAGSLVGRSLRLPSPYFLGSMMLGTALHLPGLVQFQLPPWFLAISYALVGWSIGLNFTRHILHHAARALPRIVASTIALIAFCAGLAWLLSHAVGVDPLTAYLATSPGGMDSIAIIAAASNNVNMSFIMALQTARLILVLVFGPYIARLIATLVKT
jgi:uncharacterized protein